MHNSGSENRGGGQNRPQFHETINSLASHALRVSPTTGKGLSESIQKQLTPFAKELEQYIDTNEKLVEQNRGLASRLATVERRLVDAEQRLMAATKLALDRKSHEVEPVSRDMASEEKIQQLTEELTRVKECMPLMEEARQSLDRAIRENSSLQEEVRELRSVMSRPPVAQNVSVSTQTVAQPVPQEPQVHTRGAASSLPVSNIQNQSVDELLAVRLAAARFMSPVSRLSSVSDTYKFGDVTVRLECVEGQIIVALANGSRVHLEMFLEKFAQFRQSGAGMPPTHSSRRIVGHTGLPTGRTQTPNRLATVFQAPPPSVDQLNTSFGSSGARAMPRFNALPTTPTMSSFLAGTSRQAPRPLGVLEETIRTGLMKFVAASSSPVAKRISILSAGSTEMSSAAPSTVPSPHSNHTETKSIDVEKKHKSPVQRKKLELKPPQPKTKQVKVKVDPWAHLRWNLSSVNVTETCRLFSWIGLKVSKEHPNGIESIRYNSPLALSDSYPEPTSTPVINLAALNGVDLPPSLPRSIEVRRAKGSKTLPGRIVFGVDEAGRGPLAGPVVAAAFTVLEYGNYLAEGLTDSKALNEEQRECLLERLIAAAQEGKCAFAVAAVPAIVIDEINILQATMLAMKESVYALESMLGIGMSRTGLDTNGAGLGANGAGLETNGVGPSVVPSTTPSASSSPAYCLIDGNRLPPGLDGEPVIQGDAKELVIAAASICAKTVRDRIMAQIHATFPQYKLDQHKGYPTGDHRASVTTYGPSIEHRVTFAPIKTSSTAGAVVELRRKYLAQLLDDSKISRA